MFPIPIPTTGGTYAISFIVLLFVWPLFLLVGNPRLELGDFVTAGLLVAAMIVSYVLNYTRCSSTLLSYWRGLCFISSAWMTGCVNITVLFILPILLTVHFVALFFSAISVFIGKPLAQRVFLRLCYAASRRGFDWEAAKEYLNSP